MSKLVDKCVVKAIQDCIDGGNVSYQTLMFGNGINIRIDKIRIQYMSEEGPIIHLDDECTGAYINEWKSDVGGILSKDFKHHTVDNYGIITTQQVNVIVRRIEPDEKDAFDLDGLPIVTMADYLYCVIKVMGKNYSLIDYDYSFNGKIDLESESSNDENMEEQNYTIFDEELMNQE